MIEIRTFDGGPGELAEFTVRVWRQTYEGQMPIALWSESLFRRELFPSDNSCCDFLIAAYDGRRLVGSHPSKPLSVRLHGQEIPASWGSFISVDPEYRRKGVALRLQQEWTRRHRESGRMLNLGFQYIRSPLAMGPKFWLKQPTEIPIIGRLGMLFRPIDHAAVARFSLYPYEAWGARILSLFQGPPRPPAHLNGIRLYRPDDLEACLKLLCQAGESADLAYLWEPSTLGKQLHFDTLSETVVLECQGTVAGLVNYTLMEVLGRCRLVVALIDFMAFGVLESADRRRLLRAALSRMGEKGAQAAMMLRGSNYGWRELLVTGFMPGLPEYYFIGARIQNDLPLKGIRRLQVLLR